MTQLEIELAVAKQTQKVLGTAKAAQYMAKRGWSLESALYTLLEIAARDEPVKTMKGES